MSNLKKIKPATYIIEKEESMKVPGLIIATEELLKVVETDKSLDQLKRVAALPGIEGYSIAMPDIHWGYGFPIGGVAAMNIDMGVISPGGVGYDINCGVRLAVVPILYKDIDDKTRDRLLNRLFEKIPSGVGFGHRDKKEISDQDYKNLLENGAKWSIEKGYGIEKDLDHIESNGKIDGADYKAISEHAKQRGKNQVGTLGSGNHFIEIGEVEKIFLPDIAKDWGISEGQTYVLIHTGSRGFGHQVCQDTLNTFIKKGYANNLPDKQLVAAPIKSEDGKQYFSAMAAAANFAFNNRQQILHSVRSVFKDVLATSFEDVRLIYDVCHNIAKFEEHEINGVLKKLCVHRKGATRAFGKGAKELTKIFQKTGQPVLVPGDMGTASYLLVGLGNTLTWKSSCHGAGRARSRVQSKKAWRGQDLKQHMLKKNIHIQAHSYNTIAEEMPDAYKNIDEVVQAVEEASLANKVARFIPSLVIKG